MQKLNKIRSFSLAVCASVALASSAPAFAQHAGGGHFGGGHFGGGHFGGGFRGGYGGWHGGYGWRGGFWGPWRWGWGGVGLGLYFATLPYYYSTYWWGGVPYYYADNTYYRWDPTVSQYETVSPPPGLQGQAAAPAELIAYPKNGQSDDQLGKDKFECHRWAAAQTGFDPTQAAGGPGAGARSDYMRAQAACLEGRGYSVK